MTQHEAITDDARNSTVTTSWTSEATGTGEYADVNGLHLYYETHGSGRPMILLHGIFASPLLAAVVLDFLETVR